MKPPKVFETEKMTLRAAEPDDAQSLFEEFAQDEDVTRYLSWRPHRSLQESKVFIDYAITSWTQDKEYIWVVTEKGSERAIGILTARNGGFKFDFGYVLAKRCWGMGYMTEAVSVFLDWAKEQPEVHRVAGMCDTENPGSGRVLEKAGMQKEGVLRRFGIHPNASDTPRDVTVFSWVRTE